MGSSNGKKNSKHPAGQGDKPEALSLAKKTGKFKRG